MIDGITQEDLDRALSKMGNDVSPQVKQAVEKAIRAYAEEGKLPTDTLNVSEKDLETLYAYTYQLFQSGKYQQAMGCFEFLTTLEPSYRNYFGLAACYQYLGPLTKAIGYYMICTELEPLNPVPHYHLYGCYRKLGVLFPAAHELEMTITLASQEPAYSLLKERAELEREGVKKEIDEKFNQKGE